MSKMCFMRRFLLIIIVIALPFSAVAAEGGKSIPKAKINSLISEYSSSAGVEVVNLGRIALGALRGIVRISDPGDKDTRDALQMVRGLKRLSIFEYEDCPDLQKSQITRKLNRILSGCEVLVEASGDGDRVTIYGYLDEKSNLIRDCIIYTPSSCALICLFGNFSMDTIAKIAEND